MKKHRSPQHSKKAVGTFSILLWLYTLFFLLLSSFLLRFTLPLPFPLSLFFVVYLSVSLHPEVPVWLCEFIDFWEMGESGRQGWGADSGMEIEGYKLFVTGKQ